MLLLDAAFPEEPALDMAVTQALLGAVASGTHPACARVFRPGPTMAFGRLDTLRPGYAAARAAAEAHGFTPVLRLGGGHAAGYDAGAVVVELVTPVASIAHGLQERFADGTALLTGALGACGVDAQVGELPGEYCPGSWSIHLRGGPKVAGAAQRTVRGASLFTAALVVEGGARLRAALVDVYAALELAWDPATAGAVDDGPARPAPARVAAAVTRALAARGPLARAELDPAILAAARALPTHP